MSSNRFARETAAAAAKELHRVGGAGEHEAETLARLFEQADLYDRWQLHASREQMALLLAAEWRKVRGRSLGGHVAAAMRR